MARTKAKTIMMLQTECSYKVNTTGIIKQAVALNSALDFLNPYVTYADDLSVLNYGDFKVKSTFKDMEIDNVRQLLCSVYMAEVYNLRTLVGTLDLEYNPIENYNMVEEEGGNRTNNIGERNTTLTMDIGEGETRNTVNMGKGTTTATNNVGERKNTTVIGLRKEDTDTTHQVAPFNTTTLTNTEKDITGTTQQSATDTVTADAAKDENKIVTDAKEDVTTVHTNEKQDVHTTVEDAREDTEEYGRNLTRSGNIGVTTTQQMIEQERAIANINICAMLVDIMVKNLCKGVQTVL